MVNAPAFHTKCSDFKATGSYLHLRWESIGKFLIFLEVPWNTLRYQGIRQFPIHRSCFSSSCGAPSDRSASHGSFEWHRAGPWYAMVLGCPISVYGTSDQLSSENIYIYNHLHIWEAGNALLGSWAATFNTKALFVPTTCEGVRMLNVEKWTSHFFWVIRELRIEPRTRVRCASFSQQHTVLPLAKINGPWKQMADPSLDGLSW